MIRFCKQFEVDSTVPSDGSMLHAQQMLYTRDILDMCVVYPLYVYIGLLKRNECTLNEGF